MILDEINLVYGQKAHLELNSLSEILVVHT